MFNLRRHEPTLEQKRERAAKWMRDRCIKHLQERESFSDAFDERALYGDVGQAKGRAHEREWLDGLRKRGVV